MTRGYVGRVALLCLAFSGGACAPRNAAPEQSAASEQKGASEQKPTAQQPAPAQPAAPEQKENPAMATTLECALSVPATVRSGEPVEVRFQLTNRTAQPLYVLTWRTPLEGLRGNDFQITRDGTDIAYQGPMVKRGNPSAQSYVTIAPGASVDGKVDLALAYDLKQPGRYRIAFRGQLMDVADKQAEVPRTLDLLKSTPVQCPVVETTITAP
ncbi:protease [Vitiosangium sp. GDMCC 1.1324]|uniref:protease n=1 Tax=Vitiosangium sp. (strain GDMCC 1.1324) TaxID=2138576 RepID=UPI000D394ECD|nr:protease [Vitiosangium sp. GDMCC 1.1324]PTL80874.1 protease [Vitiosangium sp. GDMCC 1.1324]